MVRPLQLLIDVKTPNRRFRAAVLLASIVGLSLSPARRPQAVLQDDAACHEPALPDTFFGQNEFVLLRVSVTGDDQKPIACLTRENFQVREDGQLQRIRFFSDDDVPVTVGLVVDAGRRMAAYHAGMAAASLAFARSRGGMDEFFALAFSDEVHDLMSSDAPFTHRPAELHDALRRMAVVGQSALYDAIDHALDYAARGTLARRVLIVISAGPDTASRTTFAPLVDRVATSPTVIYTIAIGNPGNADAGRGALKRLAALSGGREFLAHSPGDLPSILEWIARDIRTSYTIGYAPPNTADAERFRTLDVTLKGGNRAARLRYREGYVGGPAKLFEYPSQENVPLRWEISRICRATESDQRLDLLGFVGVWPSVTRAQRMHLRAT